MRSDQIVVQIVAVIIQQAVLIINRATTHFLVDNYQHVAAASREASRNARLVPFGAYWSSVEYRSIWRVGIEFHTLSKSTFRRSVSDI